MAKVCVIRQGYFPLDTRVRREVDCLTEAGHAVDVICMSRPGEPSLERRGGVRIYRVPLRRRRRGILVYVVEHLLFLAGAGALCGFLHLRRRYDVVQANSVPDSVVFAALVPRLLGARVLLDLHECVPEFFATKFGVGMRHPVVRLTEVVEQASIRFSHRAVTCTEQMREVFARRGASPEKIEVVLNSADERIFDAERYPSRPREADRFELISHGSIEERYGLDTIVRALALLRDELPSLRLKIYGEGSYEPFLRDLVRGLSLEERVDFSDGYVPLEELLGAIANADAGLVAMQRDVFRDLTHCNKMFDFISMRTPAIVSRTRAVEAYFDDSCFQFFTADDEHDLARAIRELEANPELAERLVEHAAAVNEPYRWTHQQTIYRAVVEGLA